MYLYAFAAVAVLILALACINYVNLATARAAQRTRAIGLRKILGAGRGSLIAQSLGESVLFALLATVLGVILVEVAALAARRQRAVRQDDDARSLRQAVAGADRARIRRAAWASSPGSIRRSICLRFLPLTAFVGRYRPGGLRLREALVFSQFAISIGVIACTLLMGQQMRYIANKGLGFEKENRVLLTLRDRSLIERESLIANELEKHPGVLGVATSATIMGRDMPHVTGKAENDEGVMTDIGFGLFPVGDNFIEVMGIEVVKGRDFSRRLLTDVGAAYIVNETFVRAMGWEEPIGKRIGIGAGWRIPGTRDRRGQGLQLQIAAHEHRAVRDGPQYPRVRRAAHGHQRRGRRHPRDAAEDQGVVRGARSGASVRIHVPRRGSRPALCLRGTPHEADRHIRGDLHFRRLPRALRPRRVGDPATHEGDRHPQGARRLDAFDHPAARAARARPDRGRRRGRFVVAWLAMQDWLSGFAYRAALNPTYLLLAALGAGAVALLTIALQSWRTASGDPIEALRYE